jgi:small subunit ribosomal protein S7
MARRRKAIKREVLPDARYKSFEVAKFINYVMKRGEKSIAESIVYGALDRLVSLSKSGAVDSFKEVLENVKPTMEVRSKRIGGATYQVPVPVNDSRSFALAVRWLIKAASSRGEKTMVDKLFGEMSDARSNKGQAVQQKVNMHKMAAANQAFAHFKF